MARLPSAARVLPALVVTLASAACLESDPSPTPNRAPTADAGADGTANFGERHVLNGTASGDVDGDPLTYSWTQTAGPPVTLSDPASSRPAFNAPPADDTVEFQLVVLDGDAQSVDTVTVQTYSYAGGTVTGNPFGIEYRPPEWVGSMDRSGDYGYVGTTAGIDVIDLAQPSLPLIGATPLADPVYDVAVSGTHLFAATSDGLVAMDLSVPTAPQEVGSVSLPSGLRRTLRVAGALAFVADGMSGLRIVDVSDPLNPSLITTFSSYAMSVALVGSVAYVADFLDGLVVVDVSVPATPTILGSLAGIWGFGIYVEGGLAYFATQSELIIIDVQNPALPAELSRLPIEANDVKVDAGLAYTANALGGVTVVDVSNPSVPVPVGAYHTPGWAWHMLLTPAYAFAIAESGVFGVPRGTLSFPLFSAIPGGADTHGVTLDGPYLYASTSNGLKIFDVTDPDAPVVVGSASVSDSGILLRDGLLWASHGNAGFACFDATDPVNLTPVASYTYPPAQGLAVQGDRLYLASFNRGFNILDITTLTSATVLGTYDTGSEYARAVAVDGNVAFLGTQNLEILDVTDPTAPAQISTVPINEIVTNIWLDAPFAFVGVDKYPLIGPTLYRVDVQDPTAPLVSATYDAPGSIYQVVVDDVDVYLAGRFGFYRLGQRGDIFVPIQNDDIDVWAYKAARVGDSVFLGTALVGLARVDLQEVPELTPLRGTAPASTTLDYTVTWSGAPGGAGTSVSCATNGGTCQVTAVDANAHTATLSWTVPSAPGEFELIAGVGQYQNYVLARDRVRVE